MAAVEDARSAKWIDSQVAVFVNLCVGEVVKGNRPTTTLSKEGWRNVHTEFKRQTKAAYTIGQLKNKWDAMKGDYQLFKKVMFRESGLGWNDVTKTILASDTWWNERIAENPRFKKFRNRDPSLYFTHYDTMFGDVVATSSRARAANTYSAVDLEEGEEFTDLVDDDGREGSGDSDDNNIQSPQSHILFPSSSIKSSSSMKSGRSSGSKRKKSGAEFVREGLDGLVAAMSTRSTSTTAANEDKTLMEAVAILKSMHEVPYGGDLYYYAQRYLLDKGNKTLFLSKQNNELRYGQLMYNFKYNNKAAGKQSASEQFGGHSSGQ